MSKRLTRRSAVAVVVLCALLAVATMAAIASPASAALISANNDANRIAGTLTSEAGFVTGASWYTGPSSANAVGVAGAGVGSYFPTDGPDFGALTTGDVANADPPNNSSSSGTSNDTSFRGVNDASGLKIDINVPAGRTCLTLDLAFYSEEFPEFVGSQFNDAVMAQLDSSEWSYSADSNTVTATNNFALDVSTGRQITVNTAFVASQDTRLQYDGVTQSLRARTPITPGNHSVYLTIFDAGDHIYDSAAFIDNLRATNAPASKCAVGAAPVDTDGDSLPDDWETDGVDVDNDGTIDLDLPAMGASKDRKDLFLEVDFMAGNNGQRSDRLSLQATNTVVNAFANAPVTNPDGSTGISMHLDNGSNSTMNPLTGATWGNRSRSNRVPHRNVLGSFDGSGNYLWAAFDQRKRSNLQTARTPVFRYAISAHQYGRNTNRSSGIARIDFRRGDSGIDPGSDMIVSLGTYDAANNHQARWSEFARGCTLMHELGHTVGLFHGGENNVNYEPNYLSAMSYFFQTGGLLRNNTNVQLCDYSRFGSDVLPDLDESSLSEDSGVTAGAAAANFQTLRFCNGDNTNTANPQPAFNLNTAVDWDCDNNTGGAVSTSVNGGTALETLTAHNDWANLRYRGGNVGGFGKPDLPTVTPKVDNISVKRLQKFAQIVSGDKRRPRVRLRIVKRSKKRFTFRVSACDNKRISNLIVYVGRKKKKAVFADRGGKVKVGKRKRARRKRCLVTRVRVKRGRRISAFAYDQVSNVSKTVKRKTG